MHAITPPEYAPTHKYCPRCETRKPLAEFPTSKRVSDGHSSWCRPCHREASRFYRARRKSRAKYDEVRSCYEAMHTHDRNDMFAEI